jgi:hypothetical protein
MKFTRVWAMPNKYTFKIPAIRYFVNRYTLGKEVIINPMCGETGLGNFTNDLNPRINADKHIDALEYLKIFGDNFADVVLFDPPFSSRQALESYASVGMENFCKNNGWYANLRNEVGRITKANGYVISCGWNSNGLGKKRGFVIEDGLIVAHGSSHNDTIVVSEIKVQQNLNRNREIVQRT